MRIPTARSPFGQIQANPSTLVVPSSWHLEQQIAAAMAKCDADRKRALEERAERAFAINRHAARERHENNLVRMPRRHGFKTPI